MNKLLLGLGSVGLGATALAAATASAATVELRLMETTDLHMHIVDYDYYTDNQNVTVGLARTSALINAARNERGNSVLVDNGDLIQGNPLGDFVAKGDVLRFGETHPAYKAMNLLDYDVGNIGNHEFNFGLDFLIKSLNGANFPYISSNVMVDLGDGSDQPYFQPYLIQEKTVIDNAGQPHELSIGYIGFVPPQIMNWDKDNLEGLVVAHDMVETAERFVPQMKAEGADIIVAIPHSGLSDAARQGMDENATWHLAQVEGIDAIMFGHAHAVFPGSPAYDTMDNVDNESGTIFGVPAVMPGFWGSHLGIIDLTLEGEAGNWHVAGSRSEARPIFSRENGETVALVEPVQSILDAVDGDHQATLDYMAQRVGETTASINSYFAVVQDDPSVQVVNNAQTWYVENIVRGTELEDLPILSAAAPFKAGGRGGPDYFTDVPAGDIALKNVADLYIYPNDLKVVKLTGDQVIEWLERSAGQFNTIDPDASGAQPLVDDSFPTYNFDVIDGISYRIDVTVPPRYNNDGDVVNDQHRIVDVQFEGEPINPDQQFLIATNNYRAGGGGSFPGLDGSTIVIDAPDKNRDVIANYLLSQGTFNPSADGNWQFAGWGDAEVVFKTSPKAEELAGDNMETGELDDAGFRVFTFN